MSSPINYNDPYIKNDGSIVPIGDSMGGTLTPATANELGGIKVGSGLSITGDGTLSGANIPAHTVSDAGKVLGVDDAGVLEWKMVGGMKLYYKTFTQATDKSVISDKLNRWKVQNISVEGYTPLFATCSDNLTGYWTMPTGIGYEYTGGTPSYVPVLGILTSYAGTTSTFASPITVYYAKNEDIQSLV